MHGTMRVLTVAYAVSAVALAHPGSAQQPPADTVSRDSVRRLAVVEVRASIVPTAGLTIGSGIPARVAILDAAELEAWEPRTLAEALVSQPGVSLYDDLGSPYKANLNLRGFSVGPTVGLPAGVTVFLDGVRQNEPDAQTVNFDLLPIEHVERVEVLHGAASLLGPNSLAGAVNLVTRRGAGPFGLEVDASAGSFAAYSAGAAVRGITSNGFDYYVSGTVDRERGWREATGAERQSAFANVGRSREGNAARLQLFVTRSRSETAGSLPQSIFDASPRTNFTAGDFEDLTAAQATMSGSAVVGGGPATAAVHGRWADAERFNVNQAPDANVRSITSSRTVGVTVDWRRTGTLGAAGVAVRGGLDGAASHVNVRLFEEAAGATPDLATHVTSPSVDIAGYLLAEYHVGRLTLSAGGRVDFIRIPFRNEITGNDTTSTFTHVSPRAGLSVDLGAAGSAYASTGHGFRAPAILELGCADPEAACPLPFALGDDPPLHPVRATTHEVGTRWSLGSHSLSASAYHINVRDEIFFVASETALLEGYFTNIARTRRVGAELSFQVRSSDRLSAYANYAYTRATMEVNAELFSARADEDFATSPLAGDNEAEPGDRLPLVPLHRVNAGAQIGLTSALRLGVDARLVGEQWLRGDEANETRPLASYAVADARLAWERRGWDISAVVTNVFDSRSAIFGTFNENRRSGALERFLTPMHARRFTLTIRGTFWGPEAPALENKRRAEQQ